MVRTNSPPAAAWWLQSEWDHPSGKQEASGLINLHCSASTQGQCWSQFVCHWGNIWYYFQLRQPDTGTAGRISFCFSGWKGSMKATSLERMTNGKTRTSDLQKMWSDLQKRMIGQESLLRSLHRSHPVTVRQMLRNRWWVSSQKYLFLLSVVGRNL